MAKAPGTIGRYEILGELGKGAMGTVYLARDPLIGRRIALKSLAPGGTLDEEGLEGLRRRFLNEAQSAGNLSHPGVVTIHDLIEDDGLYLALEYVEGRDLRQVLADPEPVSLEFAAEVVSGVADVLDHAHGRGVVHRDIKPANILVTAERRIKVTDFGIAHLRGAGLAEDLRQLGTPSYLAPERALGEEGDRRVDVYSLGVVLYEMVTRRLPFYGDTVTELTRSVALDDPTPPEQYVRNLPSGLREVLARALEKDPERRYAAAGELARGLEAVVERQARLRDTVPAAPVRLGAERPVASAGSDPVPEQTVRRLRPSPQRWPRRLGIGLAAVAAGLAATLVLLAGLTREPATAEGGAESDLQPVAVDERMTYLALLEEGRHLYEAGEKVAADALLARADELAPAAGRIRELRREARWQAALDVAAEREVERQEALESAWQELDRGRLDRARAAFERALKIDPDGEETIALATAIERRLADQRRTRERVEAARKVAEATPPAVEPEPEPLPPPTPPKPAPAAEAQLLIRFSSELSRGVLTVYGGTLQLLRRGFEFVERRRFLRSRPVPGGFDLSTRVRSGPMVLRVYLSLPDRAAALQAVQVELPPGGRMTLEIAVDADGEMSVNVR